MNHSELMKKYVEIVKKIKELEDKIQFLDKTKKDKEKDGLGEYVDE